MRVVVTGAAGFIGRHLLKASIGAALTVRPILRSAEATWPDAVVAGDLATFEDWPVALRGADAVVHLAAHAHRPLRRQITERAAYWHINTALPQRLAEAAAAHGVRHLVFMSTIGVNGRCTDGRGPFTVADPPDPVGPYAETKAEAEERLREIAARTGLALTIIRPVMVYGAGAPGNFGTLVRWVERGVPLPFAHVNNRRAFVAVENLVSLIQHRLAASPRGIETIIAADDERVSTADFIRQIAAARGRQARLFGVPPALLRHALTVIGRKAMADSLLGSLDVDTSSSAGVGWRPALTMADALAVALKAPGV